MTDEKPLHSALTHETTSHILANRKEHFLCHAAYMSVAVNLRRSPVEEQPKHNSTRRMNLFPEEEHDCVLFSYRLYHPDIGESSNHVLHRRQPDLRLQRTSSLTLSCLSPLCSTLHPRDPRGKDPLSSLPLIYRVLTQGGRSLIPSG